MSFHEVSVGTRRLEDYDPYLDRGLSAELRRFARVFSGQRVLHINSTSRGGGVAEILRSEIPLLRELGVDAHWWVLTADRAFYEVTKKIHNGLQGHPGALTSEEWAAYEGTNEDLGRELDGDGWDLVVVHDPQPASVLRFARRGGAKWVWRCHIDSSDPNPDYADALRGITDPYDAHVYSMAQYALPGQARAAHIIAPAIDPLSEKARPLTDEEVLGTVGGLGIDLARPLVTQVSRFDPWKDPVGVIAAYRNARHHVSGLQLALVGSSADDDPESARILEEVLEEAADDPDIHVLANRCDDAAVKAIQSHSRVVFQKSLREGFGLTVAEALWAQTPVIGGRVGGIPLQVLDGKTGFLVETIDDATRRLVQLVQDRDLARRLGRNGREHVRLNFLLPRLVRDELRLWRRLVSSARQPDGAHAAAPRERVGRDVRSP